MPMGSVHSNPFLLGIFMPCLATTGADTPLAKLPQTYCGGFTAYGKANPKRRDPSECHGSQTW